MNIKIFAISILTFYCFSSTVYGQDQKDSVKAKKFYYSIGLETMNSYNLAKNHHFFTLDYRRRGPIFNLPFLQLNNKNFNIRFSLKLPDFELTDYGAFFTYNHYIINNTSRFKPFVYASIGAHLHINNRELLIDGFNGTLKAFHQIYWLHFGLGTDYKLNNRWALTAGLGYGLISIDAKSITSFPENPNFDNDYKFKHFGYTNIQKRIGINYNLIKK